VTSGLEPVAWVVFADDGSEAATTCLNRDVAEVIAESHGWHVAPLYRAPALTDAEREAIEVAAEAYSSDHGERFAKILRGLLERTK
jgi:hypothetical protein